MKKRKTKEKEDEEKPQEVTEQELSSVMVVKRNGEKERKVHQAHHDELLSTKSS